MSEKLKARMAAVSTACAEMANHLKFEVDGLAHEEEATGHYVRVTFKMSDELVAELGLEECSLPSLPSDDCEVRCNSCGFSGKPRQFLASPSVYHDLRCPECRTSNLDTSDILRVWPEYGYGGANCLRRRDPATALRGSNDE